MGKPKAVSVAVTHEVRDACLCLHAQRAARALARRFDEAMRPLALTSGQFSLLMALNGGAPPTVSDVARVLGMDRTTLTSSLKPLVRRRLVRNHADETDGRIRRLSLTPSGASLLAEALPVWRHEHRAVELRLTTAPARARVLLTELGQASAQPGSLSSRGGPPRRS
jgi:DNA-binding MarR family transcriptional regulator